MHTVPLHPACSLNGTMHLVKMLQWPVNFLLQLLLPNFQQHEGHITVSPTTSSVYGLVGAVEDRAMKSQEPTSRNIGPQLIRVKRHTMG